MVQDFGISDEKLECQNCGNDEKIYFEISLVAKKVFNQKTGKEYIRDRTNLIDNFFDEIVYCYECGEQIDDA